MEDETVSQRRKIQNREAQRRYRDNIKRKLRMAEARNCPSSSRCSDSRSTQTNVQKNNGRFAPMKEIEYRDGENDVETLEYSSSGSTIIHLAAKKGYHNIVRMLAEAGVDVSVKDDTGQTSLHLAALCGHNDTVLVLLDAGADIDAENQQGQTALFMAVDNGEESTVKILLDAGADPNVKTGISAFGSNIVTVDPKIITTSTPALEDSVEPET
ncbi:hypothetical protein QTJ16_004197 [Diplocarpon rosae]|uniref:BZIP domain-containing protein n=1 Tax=Diplocarpon rosae TaxID=946125 RepID=A0AAD9T1N1_9HELO|nr:hypothetical protein QTJ16_004197 [Diplocarpon rosae]